MIKDLFYTIVLLIVEGFTKIKILPDMADV